MRTAEWTCPLCERTKRIFQTADRIEQSARASLLGHIRSSPDDTHGGHQRLPLDFDRDDTDSFISIGGSNTSPVSAVVPRSE